MEVPLRLTKYENSTYSYPLARTFRHTFQSMNKSIVYIHTHEEFMEFMTQQTSPATVLFGHSQDPVMAKALSIAEAVTTVSSATIVVVDVGTVPELGAKYDIRHVTLMKIYKAHVLHIYTDKFEPLPMKRFMTCSQRNVFFGSLT